MEISSAIKALFGKAVALIKPKAVERLKSAQAERIAYRGGEQKQSANMRSSFVETYQRLLAAADSDLQTPSILTALEAKFVVSPQLRDATVQRWLARADTRDDMFTLAEAKVFDGVQNESAIRGQLSRSYATDTGENENLADGVINSVLDALVASYRSRIEDQNLLTIDAVQGQLRVSHKEVLGDISGVADQVSQIAQRMEDSPSPALEQFSTENVDKRLRIILQTRQFDTDIVAKILALAESVTTGPLKYASHERKQTVIMWTVRILAGHNAPLDQVRKYLRLLDGDKGSPHYIVTEALVLEAQGQIDDAVQLLRDVENDEARSAMLAILVRRSGREAGVEWKERHASKLSTNYLTSVGWAFLSNVLAETDRWEEAFECFSMARPLYDQFPDLFFIEGMFHAVMIYPRAFRLRMLNQNLVYGVAPVEEGDAVEHHRRTAIALLAQAELLIGEFSDVRQHHAREARLWLALGSREDSVREQAMAEATKSLSDARSAVGLYHIVRQFQGFNLDATVLFAYLESRMNEAGLSDDEWINWYFLAVDSLPPSDLSKFLDEHDAQLRNRVDPRALTATHVAALIADGKQAMRARAVLDANRDAFSANEADLLDTQISAVEGADVRPQLEELYRREPTLNNASVLAEHLAQVKDFLALKPVAHEAFKLDRNEIHARKLVWCLQNLHDKANEIVEFLQHENDITRQSPDLQSALAGALLNIGDWCGAKELNDRLLAEDPSAEEYLGLEIYISTKTGNWEHFPSIFERAWESRDRYGVETLLMLAQLSGDSQASRQRALELLKLAVERGEQSPRILLAAYNAAVKLGMEDELSASWLSVAASTDTEGLVQNITLRQIVEEVVPSNQRRTASVLESLNNSSAPIHLLAPLVGLPLARLYHAIPTLNASLADPRTRAVLPFFGARINKTTLDVSDAIGLDVSAALTLSRLELLDLAIDAFQCVYIAANTMEVLLKEVHRVKFHQPSEVRLAEAIVQAFDGGLLVPSEEDATPPSWLVDEVGPVLANALERARNEDSFVIATYPIFKADSLGETQANLREYSGRTMTLRTFVAKLAASGKLPAIVAEHADTQLTKFDRGQTLDLNLDFRDAEVFIEAVAVRHLQSSGVLAGLKGSRFTMRTASSLKLEFERLIAEASERQRTVDAIDATRLSLRRGIEMHRVHLLPERIISEQQSKLEHKVPTDTFTAIAFLQASSHISRLVVDDRYFTRLDAAVSEDARQITTHSSLDIVDALVKGNKLPEADGFHKRNSLRSAGMAYVTPLSKELRSHLAGCKVGRDGTLQETYELKALRESLALSCTLETSDQRDRQFFDLSHSATVSEMLSVWSSPDVPTEQAVAVTEWLLQNIVRPVWTAAATIDGKPKPELGIHFVAFTVSLLLFQSINWKNEDKRGALHSLIEQIIMVPARRANPDLELLVFNHITGLLIELKNSGSAAGRRGAILVTAIAALPLWLHKRLMSDAELGEYANQCIAETMQFGDAEPVPLESFYKNAVIASSRNADELVDPAGYKLRVDSEKISLLAREADSWIDIELPELSGFLLTEGARLRGVNEAVALYGPTFPDGSEILSAAETQPLSLQDFSRLMYERSHGVKAHWARISAGVTGPIQIDVIVPFELEYYTRLLGPAAEGRALSDYLTEVVLDYRKNLIARGDLPQALRIAMFGYFHPTLAVSSLVEHVDNETLWTALNSLGQIRDPYSLAALAELAIRRATDGRFQKLASETIASLCAEGDEQTRLYEPASQFAQLVLSRVQLANNAAAMAPFWKRMVSWMHAGVIVEHYRNFSFDLVKLRDWVQSHNTLLSSAVEIQDTYQEPTFLAGTPSIESCRNNVIRLIADVIESVATGNAQIPGTDRLTALASKLQSSHPAMYLTAGPCATLQDRREEEMSDADKALVQQSFDAGPFVPVWSSIVSLSHILRVPTEAYRAGLDKLRVERLQADDPEWLAKTLTLQQAAILAVTCEDHDLADVVRDVLIDAAPQAVANQQVVFILNGIFLAAGARREETLRNAWLDQATKLFAQRVRPGVPAHATAFHLQVFFDAGKWQSGPASIAEHFARMAA